tara:strand:- start:39 stop:1289 length:1251 start_codon:yes stop_codon:yes gene_type:complete
MIKIVGDIILDTWIKGNYDKISPEAPVKILEQTSIKHNLGGAANVAANLREYYENIKLYGAIANDYSGNKILQLLKNKKIKFFINNNLTTTTTKIRLTKKNGEHITRVDVEEIKNNNKIEINFIKNLKTKDSVLVIDYNKGLVNSKFFKKILNKNNNVFVDPKNKPSLFKGAYLVKPNMHRVKNWLGSFSKKKCFKLLKNNKWKWLIVTDGPNGVHIFGQNNKYTKVPVSTNNLKDVSGAGDTFLSTLVYFHHIGLNIEQSCEMAVRASTKVVEKIGVATITKNEVLYEKVFTNGVFDILHKGHFKLFKFCKKIAKKLVVGINSDSSVKKIKGNERPYFELRQRIKNLEKIGIIDKIIPFNQKTPLSLIKKIEPEIIVKGGDYKKKDVVGNKYSKIFIYPTIKGYSSTKEINKLRK